jgi:hypothetical protein
MVLPSQNGNGRAVTILPPMPAISGISLAHRSLSKQRRAALAADILDGRRTFVPTQQQLALIFGVCVPMIQRARDHAAVRDYEPTSSATPMTTTPASRFGPPAPITDAALEDLARIVGCERMLAAAVAVEQHT